MKGVLTSAVLGGAIGGISAAAIAAGSSKLDPKEDLNIKKIRTE